jgi:YHS domain-containing protein
MTKDPVCGMSVDGGKEAATSVYLGKTYYHCAASCKTTLEKGPGKYAKA